MKDSLNPVESKMDKTSGEPIGGEDVKPDKTVDVQGVGGVMDLTDPKSESVDKAEEVTGDHTSTWGVDEGNTLGQADPITATTKEALETKNTDTAESVDVEAPPAEEIGENTKTWTENNGTDPVTKEEGVGGGPVGEKASHLILEAMKVAEIEIELGLQPADEKFERTTALEELGEKVIATRLAVLSEVKTAGLVRRQNPVKAKSAGRVPSFNSLPAATKRDDTSGDFTLL